MNAILDMSRLTNKGKFDLSALPTPEQLEMHVDSELFLWLAARERFYTLLPVEERFELMGRSPIEWENNLICCIAEKIHDYYCHQRILEGNHESTSVPWKDLTDDKKKSNLDAAAELPVKLGLIGHGIRKINKKDPFQTPDISDDEIEFLARNEHERWCREQQIQGWRYGQINSVQNKTHPGLVPWENLPENEQKKDRDAIYSLPCILKEVGFSIYRVETYDEINENLIRKIAVTVHQDYCKQRTLKGETKETNANLVLFDELSEEIREANYDSARTIPRKLKLLKITLQKSMAGIDPGLLELTKEEIELLSKWEHTRWNWQKILQGWVYGPDRNDDKKIHPYILPWFQLPDNIKEYDRESIRLIPLIVKEAGYQAVRKEKEY